MLFHIPIKHTHTHTQDFEVSVPMRKTAFTVEITGTVDLLGTEVSPCFENDKVKL